MVSANRADIAFAIQAEKGTPAEAAKYRTFITGGRQPGISMTQEPFVETTGSRMQSDQYVSEVHAEGDPSIYVMPKMIAPLLYAVLGGKTSTGSEDPYEHEMVPAATLPYITVWRWLADLIFERSTDCKVTHLKLHGESGKPLVATATIQGLTPNHQTAHETSAAVETVERFMHYNGAGALQVEGAAIASISEFDLDIDNGGQIVPGDSLTPNDIAETTLEVMLKTTQLVSDAALWKRIHYGSATPSNNAAASSTPLELGGSPAGIDFKWTRVAASPGPERSMEIVIPRVIALPFDLEPETGASPLKQEVTYKAFQPASGDAITATVKNGVAGADF